METFKQAFRDCFHPHTGFDSVFFDFGLVRVLFSLKTK
jgi:hypothetical protein